MNAIVIWFCRELRLADNSALAAAVNRRSVFTHFQSPNKGGEIRFQSVYILGWVLEFGASEYPAPIVKHSTARNLALHAFASIKK